MARKRKKSKKLKPEVEFRALSSIYQDILNLYRIFSGECKGKEYGFSGENLEATAASLSAAATELAIYYRREVLLDSSQELPPKAVRNLKIQRVLSYLDASVESLPEGFSSLPQFGFEFVDWISSLKLDLLKRYPDGLTTYLFPDHLPPKFDFPKSHRRRS